MNVRYTLVVFLVFVALVAFAYTQREAEPHDVGVGTPTATPAPLLELEAGDVQSVAVVAASGSYTLTRVAGGWEVDGEATNDLVDGVVTRLASPTIMGEVPAGKNPNDYGFATPALTVTLRTAAGDAHTFQVGDELAVSPNYYVRLEGGDRMVWLSNSDINLLRDWVDTPPLAPTPTPEDVETPRAEDAPAGAGTPTGDETPLTEETLPAQDTPGAEETPAGEGTPPAEETAPSDVTPAAEETPEPAATPTP